MTIMVGKIMVQIAEQITVEVLEVTTAKIMMFIIKEPVTPKVVQVALATIIPIPMSRK